MKASLYKHRYISLIVAVLTIQVWFAAALVSGLNSMGGDSSVVANTIAAISGCIFILSTIACIVGFIVRPR